MSFAAGRLFRGYNAPAMTGPLAPKTVVQLAFLIARRLIDAASAEDVAQETWVKYQAQADREGPTWLEQRARGWVRCVATNGARTLLRKQRPVPEEPVEVAAIDADPVDAAVATEERERERAQAARILAQLPSAERRLLALRALEGLSWGEIAQVLDERPSTLRSRYTRLRQRLAEEEGGK